MARLNTHAKSRSETSDFSALNAALDEVRARYPKLRLKAPFEKFLLEASPDSLQKPRKRVVPQRRRLLKRACALYWFEIKIAPEPPADIPALMRAYCVEFDRREAENLASRRRGGVARHGRNDPVKEEAASLIRIHAPREGWRSTREAANAIWPFLRQFVINGHFSMTHDIGLKRTVQRWIGKPENPASLAYKETARNASDRPTP